MKYFTKFLLIIVLLLIGRYTFSQSWYPLNTGVTRNLTYIDFLDENTGFAGPALIRTTDGGTSWISIPGTTNFNSVCFLDINTGYATDGGTAGPGSLYKTTNGGTNWTTLSNAQYPCQIDFLNANTGYFAGNHDWNITTFYGTTTGGQTWNLLHYNIFNPTLNSSYIFYKVKFLNFNTGYLSASTYENNYFTTAYVLETTDGGVNWNTNIQSSIYRFKDFSFPSINSGFVINEGSPTSGSIFDYNGNLVYSYSHGFNGIYSLNASTAYAVGTAGTIVKTTNAGANWYVQNSNITSQLNEVQFLNSNVGYIVGDSGKILKTINGGEPYNTISGQIRFQDNNQVVTSGFVKALKYNRVTNQILTLDSAQIQSSGMYTLAHIPHDSIFIMAFENDEAQLVFVPTYYPSTTTWQNATDLYPTGNLSNIDVLVYRINNTGGPYHIGGHIFSNSLTPLNGLKNAIVYAKSGSDYKGYSVSNSSGSYQVDSLTSGTYNLMVDRIGYFPANRSVGMTAFSKDTIDIIMNNVISVHQEGISLPKDYWLGNNYPNPFNPSTKIKYDIPLSRGVPEGRGVLVSLIIYDILGREVATLVNEHLQPGSYEVQCDASNYASGIYFYKLTAGDFSQTKKMVVMK